MQYKQAPGWKAHPLGCRRSLTGLRPTICRPQPAGRYDMLQFIAWYILNSAPPELARLTEHELITWRQHMVTQGGLRAASINRRLEAVRRLLRWAEAMAPWHAMSRSTSAYCPTPSVLVEHLAARAHRPGSCAPAARRDPRRRSRPCLAAAAPPHHPERGLLRKPHHARLCPTGPGRMTGRHHLSKRSTWRAIRYRIKSQHCGRHTTPDMMHSGLPVQKIVPEIVPKSSMPSYSACIWHPPYVVTPRARK